MSVPDLTLVNDAARGVHLLGLAMGFGVALVADASAARSLIRPLDARELLMLQRYHRVVLFGLALFWSSGVVLIWLRTGFEASSFSPKLQAKIGIVCVLTVNAMLIGKIGLPVMFHYQGFRFGVLPIAERLRLALLGALSSACWISAMALGVFSQLKTVSWEVLNQIIGAIFLLGLTGALLTVLISPLLVFAMDRFRRGQAARF